jgi:glutaredoxin domain-containing cysteine-rich protein 1
MVISSGQSSPSDTLDSGTCSDLDGSTPPPLPKKKSVTSASAKVTVTVNGEGHNRTGSFTSSGAEVDSDDEGSNISCDSLNSNELNGESAVAEGERQDIKDVHEVNKVKSVETGAEMEASVKPHTTTTPPRSGILSVEHSLPQGLLQDIRDRTAKLTVVPPPCSTLTRKTRIWADELPSKPQKLNKLKNGNDSNIKLNGSMLKYPDISPTSTLSNSSDDQSKRSIVEEKTYEERQKETTENQHTSTSKIIKNGENFDTDRFYKFHLNEHASDSKDTVDGNDIENEETFAGYRDLLQGKESSSTIRSSKGTVRGVKNRVRAGIATFLLLHDTKVGHVYCL